MLYFCGRNSQLTGFPLEISVVETTDEILIMLLEYFFIS